MCKTIKLVPFLFIFLFLSGCFSGNYVRPTLLPKAENVKILVKAPNSCQYKGEIVGLVGHHTGFDPMKIQKQIDIDKIIRVKNLAQGLDANRLVRLKWHIEARRIFEIYTVYKC